MILVFIFLNIVILLLIFRIWFFKKHIKKIEELNAVINRIKFEEYLSTLRTQIECSRERDTIQERKIAGLKLQAKSWKERYESCSNYSK